MKEPLLGNIIPSALRPAKKPAKGDPCAHSVIEVKLTLDLKLRLKGNQL